MLIMVRMVNFVFIENIFIFHTIQTLEDDFQSFFEMQPNIEK